MHGMQKKHFVTFAPIKSASNKAVYTTASVAYGWAGAVMQVLSPFGVFSHSIMDSDVRELYF